MMVFRHGDTRHTFLWESADQPSARWHDRGAGPVQYLCDTPAGAWAEFLRHEEITDPADLSTIRRSLWAIQIPDEPAATPNLPMATLTGGRASYRACQAEARRIRTTGARRLDAPSAALVPGGAAAERVDGGPGGGPPRDGKVIVLFGRRPDLIGWVAAEGHPDPRLLSKIRHY